MANYPLPEVNSSLCPSTRWSHEAKITAIRTIAPRRTRTRPLLPSLLRNIGPGISGTSNHRGLLYWRFIIALVKPHEGPPTFQPDNAGLPEDIQGAAERIFRRGVEERELRERVNPISPYHLHDDWWWVLPSSNNKWNNTQHHYRKRKTLLLSDFLTQLAVTRLLTPIK